MRAFCLRAELVLVTGAGEFISLGLGSHNESNAASFILGPGRGVLRS